MKKNTFLNLKTVLLIALLATTVAISCKKSSNNETTEETTALTPEEKASIRAAGFESTGAYKVEGGYIVEGDIFLTQRNLAEQQAHVKALANGGAKTEHY